MAPSPQPAPIRVLRGSRAVEAQLLDELEPLLARAAPQARAARAPAQSNTPGPLAALALPIRVVVPSRSLRLHLARRLVQHFGAVAGAMVQTLHSVALELLERAGAPAPPGDLLFPVVVRRCAREQRVLRERLDALVDGYGVVEAAVSDLLDAGFEPAHAEAVADALAAAPGDDELRARALAVVRVAACSAEMLEREGVGHRSALFRAARECLERDPERALPARALFVHGFADATGVQADLLEALVRQRGARVLLDHPPDPIDPHQVDAGVAFTARFLRRLTAAAPHSEEGVRAPPPSGVELLRAPGVHAEVRAVAERVRALLDSGSEPEGIAILARQLGPYRLPVRLHLGRLGIPFSGMGAGGPPGPAARRVSALVSLLRLRERAAAERWIDALERLPDERGELSPGARSDLLLGLHALGAARLADVALQRPGDGDLPLPVRHGLGPTAERGGRPTRRRLPRAVLAGAVAAASNLCERFEAWPQRDRLGVHLERLRAVIERDLRWAAASPGATELAAALFEPGAAPRADFELDLEDFALFVSRGTAGVVDEPLGGRGAGVQILDAMQARGHTFDHVFVLGLGRDAFPRGIAEDPLVPDLLRQRLRDLLPDLPIKSEGHDEERYLFAQLVASAPHVTLSSAVSDEDGRARPVSPFVERLRFARHVQSPRAVPSLYGARALAAVTAAEPPLRPAHEHALLAGLFGTRDDFAGALRVALEESALERTSGRDISDCLALARGRSAVLAELDPSRPRARELGPYYGFVGAALGEGDPRRGEIHVTAAESVARCPWQAFLQRLLRIEAPPDPHGALPSATPRLVGALVHRVLERIVTRQCPDAPEQLEEAAQRDPVAVAWPDPVDLEAQLRVCADELLREEGIGLPGFARVLALRAGERIALAGELDWPDGRAGLGVLGAEVRGRVAVSATRAVHFRVDRVDRAGGALRLVDYKTGRPLAQQKRAEARLRKFRERVSRGELLQAVAYARAASACGFAESDGRYVYLQPDDESPQRIFPARADDPVLGSAFEAAVGAILDAWQHGSFVPRLVEPGADQEPRRCEACEVKEACLRGESGARHRLADWSLRRADGAAGARLSPAERAALQVWSLHGES